jgi:hypothetical protein
MSFDFSNRFQYTWAAVAVGVGTAAYGVIKGAKAKKEAKRLAASRPKIEASPYLDDQLSLAKSELSSGMSGAAENAYEQGLSRDVSGSLDAILKGGGDVNNVAEIFDRSAVGRQRLALMKENLRLSQINNLVNAQNAYGNQDQQRFQFNEWAPWADSAQANAQGRQGAENMIWSGVQTAGSGVAGYMQGQQAKSDYNNYFDTPARSTVSDMNSYTPSTVRQVPNYSGAGAVQSPGANMNRINPNYTNNIIPTNNIDDSLFYPSESY